MGVSETKAIVATLTELKKTVDNLQCEVIDIVNGLDTDKIAKSCSRDNRRPEKSPPRPEKSPPRPEKSPPRTTFRNPNDIPDYDSIEITEVAQVHDNQDNESIVSIDDFVPEPCQRDQTNQALNISGPTNHLL